MLLNHYKQRSLRGSQQDATFQQDSTFPALKESTMENIQGQVDNGKVTQDRKDHSKPNKLITTLLNSKRAMAATFTNANNQSPTALQENNPFKKRVEQYFKQCDNVSLQQKLRTLAPTTINNLTMTTNRNNPITNKPFLVAPFERNSQIEKKISQLESQRASVNLKNYGQNRMASADGRRNSMLSTDGDNTQIQELTLVSNVTKIVRGTRAKSNETATDRLEKKLASIRIPSYTSIDKESVDGNTGKTKRKGESVKHKKKTPTGEQTRTGRRDSMDSDSCLNFRTASTLRHRYMQTSEEDITQKEGSLMRYFRTKVVKQRPATTHKAAMRSSIKAQDVTTQQQVPQSPARAKTAAPRRSRDITMVNQSQGEEDNEKGIGSADTSFEGFSVLDSFNISDTLQMSRPTTAMEKGLGRNGEAKRNNVATGGNTTLLSSMMHKDTMDVVMVPDEDNHLSYSDDREEIMSSSIADGFTLGDRQETFAAKVKVPEQIRKNHDFLIQIKESRRYQNQTLEYSSAQESAKGSVTSKREPITERLTEENEPNLPESDKKAQKGGWTNNLQDLVDYARQKGEQLGVEEAQDKSSRLTNKFNQALAMADFVQLKGGVVQRALRSSVDSAIPTVFRKDVREVKEAQENIENLQEKIQTFRNTKEKFHQQHQQKLEQAKIASVQRLTNTELNILHQEFLREDKHEIDVDRIDVFLKRLKFFSQLTPDVRSKFYKNAIYLHQKLGEYIFHQGDEGDLMYVILKGSVNVKILKKMPDGQSQMINVNSLYDGTHFGELAIMGVKPKSQEQQPEPEQTKEKSPGKESPVQKRFIEIDKMISARTASPAKTPTGASAPKAKRSASIQCSEETELLAINREKFQEILFSVMHKDLDAKVRILHQVPFFRNEDSFNLIPIANLLQIKQYKLGQRIIKAGDALTNFYLIADGRCKVISEVTDGYALDVEIYKDRLKPFKFQAGKVKQAGGDPQNTDGFRKTRDSSNPMRRTFDNEPFLKHAERRASTGKQDKFTKHVFFRELVPGSCFGFRPLLKTDEESRYMSNRENHSKLSVVAESPNVEVYVLPRASVMLIPERIKNLLLDGLAKMSDFDDCDISKPVQEHQVWRKFQLSVIQNALTKSEHPHLRRFRDSYKAK